MKSDPDGAFLHLYSKKRKSKKHLKFIQIQITNFNLDLQHLISNAIKHVLAVIISNKGYNIQVQYFFLRNPISLCVVCILTVPVNTSVNEPGTRARG